ncbi:MAG: neutral zinc metallopeptidase [Chloroflexi bacterium]|nr:neutral zinc metallopeptidase [Chloroflexota bacterium]
MLDSDVTFRHVLPAFALALTLLAAPVAGAQTKLTPPPASASRAQVRGYAQAVADQVDQYWKAQAPALKFAYSTPVIRWTTDQNEDGPCDGTFMYDSDTTTVCLDLSSSPDDEDESFVENIQSGLPGIVVYSIGHEWGHHIQKQRHQESTADIDINIELQADCYAGMFMKSFAASGSFTDKDLKDVLADARRVGDDPNAPISERDHGTPKQRADAVSRGFNGAAPLACEPLRTKTPDSSGS